MSKKLRPYFHAHLIEVLTNYPLRQVLEKPEALRRLLEWVIELGQFDFCPQTVIKGQPLTEFTYGDTTEVAGTTDIVEAAKVVEAQGEKNFALSKRDTEQWTLYMDGVSNDIGSGAGMMLISPKGHKIHCALHFRLRASNNEVEYEALIVGLGLAKELQAYNIRIYSDFQLVMNQVNDIYLARGNKMATYFEKANGLMKTFPIASIKVIP